jgi:hypothetical protein
MLYSFIALIGSLVFWAGISKEEAGQAPFTSAYMFYSMSRSPLIFPLCFYLLCCTSILGFLCVYHLLYVVPTLTTTQEIIKTSNETLWRHSPTDRFSFWQSLDHLLSEPVKRGLIDFRAPIGPKRHKFQHEQVKQQTLMLMRELNKPVRYEERPVDPGAQLIKSSVALRFQKRDPITPRQHHSDSKSKKSQKSQLGGSR